MERQIIESKDMKNNSSLGSLKITNYKEEPIRRVASPFNNNNAASNLVHSRSLPSLVHEAILSPLKKTELSAPPIPPKTDLFTRKNSLHQPFDRNLALNRSMNSLLLDVDLKSLLSINNNKVLPVISNENNKVSKTSTSKLPIRLTPTSPSNNNFTSVTNKFNDLKHNSINQPLATSSPIPQNFSTLSSTELPSHIPISKNLLSNKNVESSLSPQQSSTTLISKKKNKSNLINYESFTTTKTPPPIASKPKVIFFFF